MAFTMDEVFTQWQPPTPTEQTAVLTTLVVTQEDGHTSWGQTWFYVDWTARVISRGMGALDPSPDFVARFSDNEWTGLGQRQGIKVTETGPQTCHLLTILKQWGDAPINLDLALVPNPATRGRSIKDGEIQ
jgi:hypothetical protein